MEKSRISPSRHSRSRPAAAGEAAGHSAKLRGHDPDRTQQDIINVATEEFAAAGFSGARVDVISERTRTSKRMIYYYFGSKEGLYIAVLEKAYAELRAAEMSLDVERQPPVEALQSLIELTFDYQDAHPEFVRLVNAENINGGRYIAQSEKIRSLNISIIDVLASILKRGQEQGVFRKGLSPVDIHMLISSFCFFRVSNQHTFGIVFQTDLSSAKSRSRHRQLISDVVIRWLTHDRKG